MNASTADLYRNHLRELQSRADEALAACNFDCLAIHSGRPPVQFLDDQPWPFKVNPHFKHWLPLTDAPDCWLLYRPGSKPQLLFHQPADYWHKPPALPAGDWVAEFEVFILRDPAEARARMPAGGRIAFIGEWHDEFSDWNIAAANHGALLHRLHYRRAIKTPYEIECMRTASTLGARGHRAAESAFRNGASELEVHLAYLGATGHTEAELPYGNIIAFNENAAVLHYQQLERTAQRAGDRHSFLIDAGAQFQGYACDITRTHSYRDDEFAALIQRMHELQQALCAEVRAGVDYAQIHLSAHRRIARLLVDAGIITASPDLAVESGLSGVFLPHGVGHLLGLQVHDVAGLAMDAEGNEKPRPAGHPWLRLTRTLEPGFVVTIEPGLYFIDLLLNEAQRNEHGRHISWPAVERYKRYGGIRIEDDVLCTAGKPENLTRDAFERVL